MVEHFSEKEVVEGSIPFLGTLMAKAEVRVWYSGYYVTLPRLRRQFDSAHPLQIKNGLNSCFFVPKIDFLASLFFEL